MTSLEVAGVAGTWVAAGLAVIALIGIAGQIVAWRTSRTERYKAISAVGPVNYGFVGKGWWAGPNTRVYRRITAPDIKDEKPFEKAGQVWTYEGYEHLSDSLRTSNWVHFGGLLKCYKFDLRYGNVLDIQQGRTWLPIHLSYLIAIGILGGLDDDLIKVKLMEGQLDPASTPVIENVEARLTAPGDLPIMVSQAQYGSHLTSHEKEPLKK